MTKSDERIRLIVEKTTEILLKEGNVALTMRKLAANCGMSLSNLQYYYPDRTSLLKVTMDYFFRQCEDSIRVDFKKVKHDNLTSVNKFLKQLLKRLIDADDQSCIIFREIWAVCIRDKVLAEMLKIYYDRYCTMLEEMIAQISAHPKKIVSLLVPYMEGYSITGHSLHSSRQEVIDMLLKFILEMRK